MLLTYYYFYFTFVTTNNSVLSFALIKITNLKKSWKKHVLEVKSYKHKHINSEMEHYTNSDEIWFWIRNEDKY